MTVTKNPHEDEQRARTTYHAQDRPERWGSWFPVIALMGVGLMAVVGMVAVVWLYVIR